MCTLVESCSLEWTFDAVIETAPNCDRGNVWKLDGNFDDVVQIRATDRGEVILQRQKTLSLIDGGKSKWSEPVGHDQFQWIAISSNQQELISHDVGTDQWFRIRLADGHEVHRSRKLKYSLRREISPLPSGDLAYVALSGPFTPSENVYAIVNYTTGAIVRSWAGPSMEWSNAVSPNGQFVASVGLGHLMRVRLDSTSIAPEMSPIAETPQEMTVSPNNRFLAVFGDGQHDEHLTIYDTQTGAPRSRLEAPEFSEQLAFSGDGNMLAVSSKFGAFSLVDAAKGKVLCTSEDVPGAELIWRDNRVFAVYPGDNGDDCDEITPAFVTLVDDRCRVIKQHEVHGVIEVLERRADAWIVSAATWKHECGDEFELLPARKWSIDLRTGAKTDMGPYKAPQRSERSSPPSSADGTLISEYTRSSQDGKTQVAWQIWSPSMNVSTETLSCIDTATGNVLAKYPLPSTAEPVMAIATQGEWIAVADGTSVLMYPCRSQQF